MDAQSNGFKIIFIACQLRNVIMILTCVNGIRFQKTNPWETGITGYSIISIYNAKIKKFRF